MGVNAYQYHLKDHLGNVRMTLTSAQESYTYLATMESELATEEEALFGNVAETRQLDVNYDHTHLVHGFGNESARLNVNEGKVVGPTLSLYVNAGDTVKVRSYAKYTGIPGSNSSSFVIADEVTSGFGLVSGGETAEAYSAINSLLGSGSGFLGFSSDPDLPKAYLNYHYFDTDHNYITSGFVQVSAGANGNFEELALAFTADQQGYVYIYVANETQDDFNVFFDDLEVEHAYSPIIQAQSFYPFGLTFGEYRRALSKPNNFLYNSFELERSWGVYDYQARYYDPILGRFLQVDPAADLMRRYSTYAYAFDNPIRFIDPDGMMGQDVVDGPCGSQPCPEDQQEQETQEQENEPDQSEKGPDRSNLPYHYRDKSDQIDGVTGLVKILVGIFLHIDSETNERTERNKDIEVVKEPAVKDPPDNTNAVVDMFDGNTNPQVSVDIYQLGSWSPVDNESSENSGNNEFNNENGSGDTSSNDPDTVNYYIYNNGSKYRGEYIIQNGDTIRERKPGGVIYWPR